MVYCELPTHAELGQAPEFPGAQERGRAHLVPGLHSLALSQAQPGCGQSSGVRPVPRLLVGDPAAGAAPLDFLRLVCAADAGGRNAGVPPTRASLGPPPPPCAQFLTVAGESLSAFVQTPG